MTKISAQIVADSKNECGHPKMDAFDDWEKADLEKHKLQVGYLAFDEKINRQEESRVNQMLRCNDPESVDLAKIIIENLNEPEDGKNSKKETSS